jgi:hypothetical protein
MMAAGLLLALTGAPMAQESPLTVTDGKTTVTLDRDQLGELEQDVIETTSPYTEGMTKFAGPSIQAVLEKAGFAGETVNAEALDGYSIDIPRARLTGDGAILVTSMNDAPLPEEKAPYWIVFDYDSAPEMLDDEHRSWSIWQVTKLTVK